MLWPTRSSNTEIHRMLLMLIANLFGQKVQHAVLFSRGNELVQDRDAGSVVAHDHSSSSVAIS